MSDTNYAGWKNYATWAVNSWFLEPEHYDKWLEIACQCVRRNAGEAGAWSEDAIHELTAQMHESILDGVPVGLGIYSQLLDNDVKEVRWYDIAKGFIEQARESLS